MNKLPLLAGVLSMALFPVFTQAEPDPNFHIYLALGQSNMQGAAHLPDTTISHPRVKVLQSQDCNETEYGYGTWRGHFQPVIRCKEGNREKPDGTSGPIGLSPVDTFAVTMAEAEGEDITIGIVGAAYGGSDIRAHLPNCADYDTCKPPYGSVTGAPVVNGTTPIYQWILDLAKKAQKVGVIKGIIFHHGESNAGQEAWIEYVNQLVTHLREDLNLDPAKVPFIAGELPRTGCCATVHNPLVHRLPDYIENAYWVSSGPMPDGTVLGDRSDHLHWSTFSVIEMGKRYAAKMLEVGNYPSADSQLSFEFEDFSSQSSFAPFETKTHINASGEQYIMWPDNDNQVLTSPSDSASGQVTAAFTLSEKATVGFKVRADMATADDDSFYYKLDAGDWKSQNQKLTSGWATLSVATFSDLAAGDHTLQILRREDGAKLDKLYLTASAGDITRTSSDTPSTDGGITASLTIKDDWTTGYCADVKITNNGQSSVKWNVSLDIEGTASNVYNAKWSQDGTSLTLSGVSWNDTVAAGASISSVGFCAKR